MCRLFDWNCGWSMWMWNIRMKLLYRHSIHMKLLRYFRLSIDSLFRGNCSNQNCSYRTTNDFHCSNHFHYSSKNFTWSNWRWIDSSQLHCFNCSSYMDYHLVASNLNLCIQTILFSLTARSGALRKQFRGILICKFNSVCSLFVWDLIKKDIKIGREKERERVKRSHLEAPWIVGDTFSLPTLRWSSLCHLLSSFVVTEAIAAYFLPAYFFLSIVIVDKLQQPIIIASILYDKRDTVISSYSIGISIKSKSWILISN